MSWALRLNIVMCLVLSGRSLSRHLKGDLAARYYWANKQNLVVDNP